MPSVPPKTSPGPETLKTGLDYRGTSENESRSAKLENETRRPQYHGKRLRERKTRKRDPTHWHRRKLVRERKT
jgi:hypothetical protein